MRRRQIDPDFFSSDQVIACSPFARLLFIGLWCIADREGRLLDEPARIKRQVLPDDHVDGDALLGELASAGLIDRYVVDETALICCPGFKRQPIHPHEAASKLPPPPRKRDMSRQGSPKEGNVTRLIKPSVNQALGYSGPSVEKSPNGDSSHSLSRNDVQAVWDAWAEATKRTRSKLDEKRRKLIVARLREFPVADLVAAVRGWKHDPWPDRARQNGIEILLRDPAHVEKFRDLEVGARPAVEAPRDSMSDERRAATDAVAAELRRQKAAAEAAL